MYIKDFPIFSHKMHIFSFIETSFIYSLLERIFSYVFIFLRIYRQAVYICGVKSVIHLYTNIKIYTHFSKSTHTAINVLPVCQQ